MKAYFPTGVEFPFPLLSSGPVISEPFSEAGHLVGEIEMRLVWKNGETTTTFEYMTKTIMLQPNTDEEFLEILKFVEEQI